LGVVAIVIFVTLIIRVKFQGADRAIWDNMELSLSNPVAWARIMITAGSYGVSIIPSGLVLTTSVTMMISIASLTKKQTLVQELYSLENLSRADTICLDKIGTLTDGTMILEDVKAYCHLEDVVYHVQNLLGTSENKNSTAMALFNKFGENKDCKIKEIIPFSSQYKYSGIVYEKDDRLFLGAPEYLLSKEDCRISIVDRMAKQGKRVIALKLNDDLLCFFIIRDHIRESAKGTLNFFRENNVNVKVISGDNPVTVSKIASDCGISNSDKYISLEGVSLEDIDNYAEEYTVFGRVSPEQKEALVMALQKKNHKVAMTGDGVNDILALRRADSSISFANATEAAKSVSDVILLDNDFSHLKEVVGEGRRVINNVQKTAILFLMKSIAMILLAFFTIPLAKGQMWFTIESSYLLEASVIGTGGFFISISEGSREPFKGSFIRNINMKAILAGLLAAIAIVIPIVCYTIPTYFHKAPIIKAENIRTMITVLLTMAGYVVLLTLCLPFKGQQAFAFLITLVTGLILAFALPTSYIGGNSTGADMFISKEGSLYNS
jgi:cation-transporting ATPase E